MAQRQPLPSLDPLLSVAASERERQLSHFEALDNKAGVTLGFSGVIAALATDVDTIHARFGIGAAILAAILAMLAFVPRTHPLFDLRKLRNRYLSAENEFTRLRLLDTSIDMYEQANVVLRRKARFLSAAMAALVVAVVLLGLGTMVSNERGGSRERPHTSSRGASSIVVGGL